MLGHRLHLLGEIVHVWIQAVIEQGGFVVFLFAVERLRLPEAAGERLQMTQKKGHRNLVDRNGHGDGSLRVNWRRAFCVVRRNVMPACGRCQSQGAGGSVDARQEQFTQEN